jgi:flagellar protein FlbD
MILLTKINKASIAVNADLIQYIEETPDTVLTMTNGEKVVVIESMASIIQKMVHYRRMISGLANTEYERQLREGGKEVN